MLTTLCFKGIDESTNLEQLRKLSEKFPFVEWEIEESLNFTLDTYLGINTLLALSSDAAREIIKYNNWENANYSIKKLPKAKIMIPGENYKHFEGKLSFDKNREFILTMCPQNRELINRVRNRCSLSIIHRDLDNPPSETFWPPYYNFDYVLYEGQFDLDNIDNTIVKITETRERPFGLLVNTTPDLVNCEKIIDICKSKITHI